MPKSHHWPESKTERTSDGAKVVGGFSYSVPSVVGVRGEKFSMIRPNPNEDEVLVFSPYCVHGGAVNFNADLTRISLEMRFWRSKKCGLHEVPLSW
jgi:hypothetical protein